jgi:hypothetical protein
MIVIAVLMLTALDADTCTAPAAFACPVGVVDGMLDGATTVARLFAGKVVIRVCAVMNGATRSKSDAAHGFGVCVPFSTVHRSTTVLLLHCVYDCTSVSLKFGVNDIKLSHG